MTGGDPLLSEYFVEMCEYLRSKFPKEQCGLWTCLPKGKEEYGKTIVDTFSHVFINDHTRPDIYHHPFFVSNNECFTDKDSMWLAINSCLFQNSWSASISPKGCFFCEMASSFANLFDEDGGWPIEKGWWKRPSWTFKDQIEKFCPKCGGAACLPRRSSQDKVDDISPNTLERLRKIGSKKIEQGRYVVSDCKQVNPQSLPQMAAYKDFAYRNEIAARYGLFLTVNQQNYWSPHLKKNGYKSFYQPKKIYDIYREKWA